MIRVVLSLCFIMIPFVLFAQNMVTNGDFESGSIGWSGGVITQDNPHSGKNCILIRDESNTYNVAAISDFVDISQDEYYKFSLWYRSIKDGHRILVAINQYDSNSKWISGNNIDIPLIASSEWGEFSVVIRAFNPKTAKIRIYLYATLWTDRGELIGDAYYDDVRFERITLSESTYGYYLVKDSDLSIWQSPVSQKVLKGMRPSANETIGSARFYAARGEYESLQLVVTPERDIDLIDITLEDFIGEKGILSSSAFKIYTAYFVNITVPTDIGSIKGEIPDPLVDLHLPISLKKGQSQPIYFIVKIPEDAVSQEYESKVRFTFSQGIKRDFKIHLKVWDFTLPRKHSIRTAYGMSLSHLSYYHNLGGDYDALKEVVDLYIMDMAEHRITPINPFFDDSFSVSVSLSGFVGGEVIYDSEDNNHYLKVIDDSLSECKNAMTQSLIKIDRNADYVLMWDARGELGNDYLVSVNQYDKDKKWISGNNLDFVRSASSMWRSESVNLSGSMFNPDTEYVMLRFYARRWTNNCELKGRTDFDNISFKDTKNDKDLVPNGDFEADVSDAVIDVDFTRFDKRASYLFDVLNFDSFRLPLYHFASGDWSGQNTNVDILGYKWGTKEYEDLFIKITQTITRHLKEKNILKYAYTYWYDEPSDEDYDLVIYGNDLIHRAEPELKRLLTEQAENKLIGYVDIWSPILNEYNTEWALDRQKDGDEIFWYVCTGPKSPYPNNFIDHLAIEHRILFWMNWKFNVTGSLYWDITYWDDCIEDDGFQNPYLDPQSYVCGHPSYVWGNGDGRLVYPPYGYTDGIKRISGPTTSIRWELIRDGIEDYEYFTLLKRLVEEAKDIGIKDSLVIDAERLLHIPSNIVDSLTNYTKDPILLEDYRVMVGNNIEKLQLILNGGLLDAGVDIQQSLDSDIFDVEDEHDGEIEDVINKDIAINDELHFYEDILDAARYLDDNDIKIDSGERMDEAGGCSCNLLF